MKKLITLALTFLGIITITSCSNIETYSLKEAGGFEISNIAQIQASSSVYQSFAWPVSQETYQYLDCEYIKVDFDINNEFLSSWPPSELKDDAYKKHRFDTKISVSIKPFFFARIGANSDNMLYLSSFFVSITNLLLGYIDYLVVLTRFEAGVLKFCTI